MSWKDRHRRGRVAEARFVFEAHKNNWDVAAPLSVTLPYDYALRRSKKEGWKRVQVKVVGNLRNGIRRADIRKSVGSSKNKCREYTNQEVDYFFLYCEELNRSWLLPFEAVDSGRSIVPENEKYDKYKL